MLKTLLSLRGGPRQNQWIDAHLAIYLCRSKTGKQVMSLYSGDRQTGACSMQQLEEEGACWKWLLQIETEIQTVLAKLDIIIL